MGITAPRDVTRSCCVVCPAFEGAAALAADDLSGKGVALLVFFAVGLDVLFSCMLLEHLFSGLEVFMADDGFVMIPGKVHILFSMIIMAVEE